MYNCTRSARDVRTQVNRMHANYNKLRVKFYTQIFLICVYFLMYFSLQSRRILERDPWIVFRNNVVPPSWTLILPESWDESKTSHDQCTSEFSLKNACPAGYVYLCVYIFTRVFHACSSRGICVQYGGFPRMKHACNATMAVACTVS